MCPLVQTRPVQTMDLVSVDKRRLCFELNPALDNVSISDTLTVNNVAPHIVAFKVKTNNQDRYIVRPNVGVIDAESKVSISISFHPMAPFPDIASPCKDKFLLRVSPISHHQTDNLADFWAQCESDPAVRGIKFHVDFNVPDEESEQPETESPIDPVIATANGTAEMKPFPPTSPDTVINTNTSESLLAPADTAPEPPGPEFITANTASFPPLSSEISSSHSQTEPLLKHTPYQAVAPHARDMPPNLISTSPPPPEILSSTNAMRQHHLQARESSNLTQITTHPGEDDGATSERRYQEALAQVAQLQTSLDEKNLELSRLKTELAETRAETERVLKNAPSTPLPANSLLSDPFGGVSVTGLGLMLVLFLLVVNIILRFTVSS